MKEDLEIVGSLECDPSQLTIGAARVESGTPVAYRLMRKKAGTLVLQGAYTWWQQGWGSALKWRDIPTQEE